MPAPMITPEATQEPTPTPEPTPEPTSTPTATPIPANMITPEPTQEPTRTPVARESTPPEEKRHDEVTVEITPDPSVIPTPSEKPETKDEPIFTHLEYVQITIKAKKFAETHDKSKAKRFSALNEEEMEELIDILGYDTPLYGALLPTGDDIPAYIYICLFMLLACLIALVFLIDCSEAKDAYAEAGNDNFDEIKGALLEAIAYERGELRDGVRVNKRNSTEKHRPTKGEWRP